ncbi:MAG TPA: hypothetical protein PKX40_10530 [Spirochaetota bacterium]|nr:hypothetical protein [Spirochaetota bacterium]
MKADKIIEVNEEKNQATFGRICFSTMKETLKTLLDAEADAICNAQKYKF